MSGITLVAKYKKNSGLVVSIQELQDLYLYGISPKAKDGSSIPNYVWESKILNSQREIEKFLAIKFQKQLITETLTYYRDDYSNSLPILNSSFPVSKVLTLQGMINGIRQVSYPREWLNNYISSDEGQYRRINLIPTGSSTNANTNILLIGLMAQYGLRSLNLVPNYWTVQYLTGYSPANYPIELVDVVGKLASIQMLAIFGDIILPPGLSGSTLSIDGLSQSLNTVASAKGGAFSGRISQYTEDIKTTLLRLEKSYKGINFACL